MARVLHVSKLIHFHANMKVYIRVIENAEPIDLSNQLQQSEKQSVFDASTIILNLFQVMVEPLCETDSIVRWIIQNLFISWALTIVICWASLFDDA